MRNLKLLKCHSSLYTAQLAAAQCLAVDCDTGTVFVARDTSLYGIDTRTQQVVHQAKLDEVASGHVVDLQYLPDHMQVCVATSGGDLATWEIHTNMMECVGSVPSGFQSMSWSPDQQLLVLATGQQTIILMTRDFEPITEVTLQQAEFGEAEFVTVGWGKKETQFHGSEGKGAAKKKEQQVSPALSWDDSRVRVSWRGDGQFFVVSTISQATGARQLRVFTRDGQLHSTSEDVNGLEQCLCWRPSGNLIACSQVLPNKHEVVFFEKNGLRHGQFTLPFEVNEVKVREVAWNLESTVLMTWIEELSQHSKDTSQGFTYVILWTVNNYHWYQKQTLKFDANQKIASILWDPEHAYQLHIMCTSGEYLHYTWSWCTDYSAGRGEDDSATVAVVDGNKVLMTPFSKMIVPPPMCAYELRLPCAVNQIVFAPPTCGQDLMVLLRDGRLAMFRFDGEDKMDQDTGKYVAAGGPGFAVKCGAPHLQGIYSISQSSEVLPTTPLAVHHVSWIAQDTLIFTSSNREGSCATLHVAELEKNTMTIELKSSLPVDGSHIIGTALSPDMDCVAIQMDNGTVLKYEMGSDFILPWETSSGQELNFPQPCTQMAICRFDQEVAVLGLTDRYRFYANDVEIASNCTSFYIHDEFLLLTTHAHTCRCISLHTKLSVLPTLSDGKAHPFDESIRRLERGSKIVVAVQGDTKLVLQMPRGNLETIHPRALVLSCVRKHLDKLQFSTAFNIMQKHRINMNLIYDHNPQSFLDHTETFIKQITDVNHINLFLTSLQEDDVTQTMYTAAYHQVATSREKKSSKVDCVCEAMKSTLEAIDSDKYLLCILTAHVKKSSPELEVALERIKALKDGARHTLVSAEEALRYLLFLVDVNELYNVALGTYDFDLVMMVAEKSQKDPKEYLPFLNELRRLETNYQRYSIDKHLKRFDKALQNISKCGADHFSECMSLVKEHELYSKALTLFLKDSQEYQEMAVAYGEHLIGKRLPGEAAIVFSKAGEHQRALEAYDKSHNWRMVFVMAKKLKYTPEKEAELARKMAGYYKEHQRHLEAACILEQYLNDYEDAIATLIAGTQWEEALRLVYKYNRLDFLETDLIPALHDSFAAQTENLETSSHDFTKYTNRLSVVREKKEQARLEFLDGGGYNDADADLFSDASSATGESMSSSRYTSQSGKSNYSRTSSRSSKNRRKLEKKKWSLKEGSQYEDLALIEALSKIIKSTQELKDDICLLCRMLAYFDLDDKASSIQTLYEDLLAAFERHIPEIWTESMDSSSSTLPVIGPDSTTNSIVQAMQQGSRVTKQEPQLDAALRIPPSILKSSTWKLQIL